MKNRFNSTLRRLFANQTKPAVDAAAAKKRKAGADAGKSKRLRGSASPKSSTDSDDDIITGLEQLVQASIQVERHASGGEESDDGEESDKERARNENARLKEAGESSVRGAKAFSDLASLASKGFAGVPGISAAQMAATAAAFENYKKAAQAASSAAYAAGLAAAAPGPAMAKMQQPSFHAAQSDAPSTSTSAFPGALAAFGGKAAAAAANPLFASLVQAGNPAMMMGANQALAQRLLLEAQIKNAAALNAGKAVPKAVPNGSEASDMSAHGGTAWAAAMAAMGQQFYAQMLHNPSGLSAILHKG